MAAHVETMLAFIKSQKENDAADENDDAEASDILKKKPSTNIFKRPRSQEAAPTHKNGQDRLVEHPRAETNCNYAIPGA